MVMQNLYRKVAWKIQSQLFHQQRTDFVICGAQKGGTTALDAYLREHPEICMAKKKEVHFFDREKFFSNNKPNYSRYHAYFSPNKQHRVFGEATPIYMFWEKAIQRIYQYNPNMKLIVVLRDPVKRAYSHWNMERIRGNEDKDFIDAISYEQQMQGSEQQRVFSYVQRGFYLQQLENIWSYFPKQQVLVLKNEELKLHPQQTLARITDFLEVKKFSKVDSRDVHSRTYFSKMSFAEKDYLSSLYIDEVKALEKALDWDCSAWLK